MVHGVINISLEFPHFPVQESGGGQLLFLHFFFSLVTHSVSAQYSPALSFSSTDELALNSFCARQIPSPRSCQPSGASEEALRCELEELKRKDLALDQEIAELLSEYVLGKLSVHCETTIIFAGF